ncbi:hypothetical protein [Kitasatospora griseola]|uniref:hypothetical protein n=1 Tax=Kitasatospora griseola TaxID=2064 RepID=UPI0006964932|nr:hypothetical protein [Kitasatospora griseola]
MKRPVLVLAAAALATMGALTGCGSTHVTGSGSAPAPDPQASASISKMQQEAQERWQREIAEADLKFPEVAKLCAGKSTVPPTPVATAGGEGGTNPENSKYAENHAYLQMATLTESQRCRGEAHAARIAAAAAKNTPADETQARTLMTGLAYPGAVLSAYGDGVHFTLSVPGSGGCLTGVLSGAGRIEVHGAYLEGGCERPRGGH